MLDALHPELLDGFESLPDDVPVAFLTRHSIREQPQNGFASYDVPLTQEGVDLAVALGRHISRPVHRVFSSPVQRCIDTAQALLDGQGANVDIEKAGHLVEPGSYVQDIEKVAGLFFKLGPVDFANKHLRGEVRGVLSPEEGTRQILQHLKSTQGPANSLNLHVTHDTILAAFVYSLLGMSEIEETHWPWMMEGAYVWFRDKSVHWVWRGNHYQTEIFSLD
ncbi:MAG: histidine phosphatase family protein [Pseudomonadales bacterium]|nr:histidine phosphatase family protein [Pseudomonadales bacterium]